MKTEQPNPNLASPPCSLNEIRCEGCDEVYSEEELFEVDAWGSYGEDVVQYLMCANCVNGMEKPELDLFFEFPEPNVKVEETD